MNISVIVIIIILTILVCAVFYYLCNDKDKPKISGGKLTPKQALHRYEYYLDSNSRDILINLNIMYENISALEGAIEKSYKKYNKTHNIDRYYIDMDGCSHNNKEFIEMLNEIITKYDTTKGIHNLIDNIKLSLDTIKYNYIYNHIYNNNTDSDIIKVNKINDDFIKTYKYIKRNIRYIVDDLIN